MAPDQYTLDCRQFLMHQNSLTHLLGNHIFLMLRRLTGKMEAYAGGRQKTHQDNFDDLDLEGPAHSDNGKELNDDDNLRHRLVTPGVQQKKSQGIKINLHSNNKKAAELKQILTPQVPLPGPSPFRPGFIPIGANNPIVLIPPKVPLPPANLITEAEELRLRNEKVKHIDKISKVDYLLVTFSFMSTNLCSLGPYLKKK